MAGPLTVSGNRIVDGDGQTVLFGVGPNGVLGVEDLAHQGPMVRWRQKLAVARTGGLSAQLLLIADSMARFNAGKYRNSWVDRLRRRMQGTTPGTLGFLPATEGVFAQTGNATWPGGDDPWTFGGSVTGNIDYGFGFHAANVPSGGGSATITYFGDKVSVTYARTTGGPTACAVTLDGVSQTVINANGADLPGQAAIYGTHGDYGFHTLVITPNNGTLVLEGVQWFDADAPLFTTGSVVVLDGSHAGFAASNWGGASNTWSGMVNGADAFTGLVVIQVGVNDASLGRTIAQYEDDLVTIAGRIDARISSSDVGFLFLSLPGLSVAYAEAAWRAAKRIGSRAAVLDLAQLRKDRLWGSDLSGDGVHPNDAGHAWVADVLGQVIDPTPPAAVPVTPTQQVFHSSQPATARSSWTEAWTASGEHGYDQSGGGTTVGERRHRIWLDPGTYRATVTMQEDTGLGTVEVLLGRWAGNTQELVSCGTKANAAGAPTTVTTRLATSVTTDVAGWVPVVVRKTAASGAIRFMRLVLDKTA